MIKFVDINPENLSKEMLKDFEDALGEKIYPADERYIFLHQLTQVIVGCYAKINAVANSNFLRYATDKVLEEYGTQYGVARLQALKSSTIIEFTTDENANDVAIPHGTQITPNGSLVFATLDDIIVTKKNHINYVKAVAEHPGQKYNGFYPGQICNMLNPIPFIKLAKNTTISSDGSDVETDESYRERIQMSWERLTTAGPTDGYIYHTKSISTDIADVSVASPVPGVVNIYILMQNATDLTDNMRKIIEDTLSASKVRPLTDQLHIYYATKKEFNIEFTYYIDRENAANQAVISEKIVDATNDYIKLQKNILGKYINPDVLRQFLFAAGATRVEIKSPANFTKILPNEVGIASQPVIDFGGII